MHKGMPKPVCSSHTAMYCAEMPSPRGPRRLSIGWKATWIGTTITAMMSRKKNSLTRKSMNVNA